MTRQEHSKIIQKEAYIRSRNQKSAYSRLKKPEVPEYFKEVGVIEKKSSTPSKQVPQIMKIHNETVAAKEQELNEKRQRQVDLLEKQRMRNKNRNSALRKTAKGQPLMKNMIGKMLCKIKKDLT